MKLTVIRKYFPIFFFPKKTLKLKKKKNLIKSKSNPS